MADETRAVSKKVALSHPSRGILRGEKPIITNVVVNGLVAVLTGVEADHVAL
jgi:hypothetical protein